MREAFDKQFNPVAPGTDTTTAGDKIRSFAEQIVNVGKEATKAAEEAEKARRKYDAWFGIVEPLQDKLGGLGATAGDVGKTIQDKLGGAFGKIGDVLAQQTKEAEKRLERIKGFAAGVFAETRTPMEQFKARMKELTKAKDTLVDGKPLINSETFQRAAEAARKALKDTLPTIVSAVPEFRSAGALEFGSAAARTAQLQHSQGRTDPIDRLTDVNKQQLTEQQEMNIGIAKLAAVFDSLQVVSI